jgi:CheY-like chemotaxis protein
MRPQLEYTYDENAQKELNALIELIKDKVLEISKLSKNSRIKLLQISQISFNSKIDPKTRETHTITYKNFHNTILGIIDNFLREIIDPLYDAVKNFNRLIVLKAELNDYLRWHAIVFRSIKESLRFLKLAVSNNNVMLNHIEEYRKNLINKIKINEILEEVKKIRPIGLMRSAGRIKVSSLSPESIFNKSLYTDTSILIKEAYVPFTAEDIAKLKENSISYLYKHNNMDKNLKPSDYQIFIVDDDKVFTDATSEQLKDLQFNVEVFNDAEKALKEITSSVPDMILLDIKMPGINGISFLKAIYNQEKNKIKLTIPIIMITAWANERLIIECINLGAYDYIVKPFTIDDLLVKITSYLNIKGQ